MRRAQVVSVDGRANCPAEGSVRVLVGLEMDPAYYAARVGDVIRDLLVRKRSSERRGRNPQMAAGLPGSFRPRTALSWDGKSGVPPSKIDIQKIGKAPVAIEGQVVLV
jgi:hypothetical protein